jgi:PAS domain-containing protein
MSRPQLRLIEAPADSSAEWAWFCGHCAAQAPEPPAPTARVCPHCGLGLFLETRLDVLPEPDDAFLVVDSALLIQAVSVQAERMLGVSEEMVVNQPVSQLVVPADAEALGPSGLAAAVADVMANDETMRWFVRPWNTFGVRMRARIGACGPPRAALVVLEAAPHSLRLVEA